GRPPLQGADAVTAAFRCAEAHPRPQGAGLRDVGPAPCCDLLFLRAGRLGRLPSRALLARRGGDLLYLLFLGLLGFPIASLLAVGHLDLPWFDDAYKRNLAATRR